MVLLTVTSSASNNDATIALISALSWIAVTLILAAGAALWYVFTRSMTRFDNLDTKLDPIVTKVALLDEQIKEIKNIQSGEVKIINRHEVRITELERTRVKVSR